MQNIIEEYYQSKTKEAVNLRVWATLFDYVIMLIFFFSYTHLVGEKAADGKTYVVTGSLGTIPVIFWLVYFIIIEKIFNGTVGHKLMGLKVQSLNNEKLSLIQVIKRRVCDIIDFWWCFGLIAIILSKNTVNHQRLGDIWAKTIVVKAS